MGALRRKAIAEFERGPARDELRPPSCWSTGAQPIQQPGDDPMDANFADSTAPSGAERVTRESNLIARNFECLGAEAAAAATADHIRRFWAPLLRSTLLEQVQAHRDRFSPIARDAIARLTRSAD